MSALMLCPLDVIRFTGHREENLIESSNYVTDECGLRMEKQQQQRQQPTIQ